MDITRAKSFSNSQRLLMQRELGRSRHHCTPRLEKIVAQRVLGNVAKGKHVDAVYESGLTGFKNLQIRYPHLLLWAEQAISLWCFESGKRVWTRSCAAGNSCKVAKLLEECVVCVTAPSLSILPMLFLPEALAPSLATTSVWVFNRDTGEQRAQYPLSQCSTAWIEERDVFIMEEECKKLIQLNLDQGRKVRQINLQDPQVLEEASSSDFLVLFLQETFIVHHLKNKGQYQIKFDFRKNELVKTSLEGTHLFFIVERSTFAYDHDVRRQTTTFHSYVFDLEKKIMLLNASEEPAFQWTTTTQVQQALLYKEWIYLGDNKGCLTAINWVNRTSNHFGQHPKYVVNQGSLGTAALPIDYLSVQEGLLITGSRFPQSKLFFWNLSTLTLVGKTDWPDPYNFPVFSFGKLVLMNGSKLEVRDYSIDESSS